MELRVKWIYETTFCFPVEKISKQGDALSRLQFNYTLDLAIRMVQEANFGLDINNTHHVMYYADDENLIDDGIEKMERSAEVLSSACKDTGLALNAGKTKCMEEKHRRCLMANENIPVGNNSNEKVKTVKYLWSLLTNQNSVQEKMKCTLQAENACYYSVQPLVSHRILSKIFKLKYIKQ